MSDLGDGQLEPPNRWRRFTEECLPASASDGWMWRVSANGAPVEADLSMTVPLDPRLRAGLEAARAALPTVADATSACPGLNIPCPSFEEATVVVRPYLEIAERTPGNRWVNCLTCGEWVCEDLEGATVDVLEHAKDMHRCRARQP